MSSNLLRRVRTVTCIFFNIIRNKYQFNFEYQFTFIGNELQKAQESKLEQTKEKLKYVEKSLINKTSISEGLI